MLRDLPSPQAQAIHSRLADYYLQQSPQPTGECVHHLVEAGRSQQAAPMALALARQDGTRIASERSRRLYEIYLQHCPGNF